jgi:hypothetical protein
MHLCEGVRRSFGWISDAWQWLEKPVTILGKIGAAVAAIGIIVPWIMKIFGLS